jgi:hypothetical protein
MSPRAFEAEAQPILTIQTIDPLVVHEPAFPPQEDVDPKVAVADAGLR